MKQAKKKPAAALSLSKKSVRALGRVVQAGYADGAALKAVEHGAADATDVKLLLQVIHGEAKSAALELAAKELRAMLPEKPSGTRKPATETPARKAMSEDELARLHMTPVQRRKALRREARERQRTVLPSLRKSIKRTKAHKAKRLKRCQSEALRARAAHKRNAEKAREKLRAKIIGLRTHLKATAKKCKGDTRAAAHAELERSLAALDQEREHIAKLRRQADSLRSDKGHAGGLRAAELRAESDEEVQRNLPNDAAWLEAWKRHKASMKATPHMSRTEAFLEHVHKHPHLLDEARSRLERKYEQDADALFESLQDCANSPEGCPEHWHRELRKAEDLLHADPLPF